MCSNISVWDKYESCIRQLEHTDDSLVATRLLHESKTQQGMNLNIAHSVAQMVSGMPVTQVYLNASKTRWSAMPDLK